MFFRSPISPVCRLLKARLCRGPPGHDSTIVPVLAALGIYDDVWPPYASNIVVELAVDKHNGRGYVRVIYNDDEIILPKASRPHGAWIRLEDLQHLLKQYIPTDYQQECQCRASETGVLGDAVGDTYRREEVGSPL